MNRKDEKKLPHVSQIAGIEASTELARKLARQFLEHRLPVRRALPAPLVKVHESRLQERVQLIPAEVAVARIFDIKPGPIVSPACTGTPVVRPSVCRKKWWLPLIRTTSIPALFSAATSSLPVTPGKTVMRRALRAGSQ